MRRSRRCGWGDLGGFVTTEMLDGSICLVFGSSSVVHSGLSGVWERVE